MPESLIPEYLRLTIPTSSNPNLAIGQQGHLSTAAEIIAISGLMLSSSTVSGVMPGVPSITTDLAFPPTISAVSPVVEDFRKLRDQWKKRPPFLSARNSCALPEYMKIIGLGKQVLPLILQELNSDRDEWYCALEAIARVNPIPTQDYGRPAAMRTAWLKWGKSEGLI